MADIVDALEQLESCETLFLVGICESEENRLQILLQEAGTQYGRPKEIKVAGTNLGVGWPIAPDKMSRYFQLDWSRYIAYQVINETYSKWPKGEIFAGKLLRVFAESAYLRFLREASHASNEHPGSFQHYKVVTQMHIVDIAAENPPKIATLNRQEVENGVSPVCRVAFPR